MQIPTSPSLYLSNFLQMWEILKASAFLIRSAETVQARHISARATK